MNPSRICAVLLYNLMLGLAALPISPCKAERAAVVPNNPAKVPLKLIAVGARYATNVLTDKEGALERVDAFWSWRSPYAWEFASGWDVSARMNASVGAIRGQGETGGIGTLVPTLAIGDTDNFFTVEGGVGVALFTKWEYADVEDFGGPLQFILDVGFNFRVYKRFGLGYRFQHWSDAGIHGPDNRGVEMHMLEFSYRF
jgi:hypothetical protein